MGPLLEMSDISKAFGATRALDSVTLSASSGRVLALIGENGAGKSTLMKVLSGAVRPDSGTIQLAGQPFEAADPLAARRAGIAMIYQELNLAPDLSIEDNIMLGREVQQFGYLRRHRQTPRVKKALAWLGHPDLDPARRVGELSIAEQQLIEIARALVHQARVIVFDEPTSSLAHKDALKLFEVISKLRSQGLAVIYISHFLEEIRAVCDDYAVLRDGRSVGSGPLSDVTEDDLVRLMVGRSVEDLFPQVPHTPGEVVLDVHQLAGRRLPKGASFQLRRGEILGFAGLIGAGRTELMRLIYGLDTATAGEVRVRGERLHPRPDRSLAKGIALVSEDRKREGLALDCSINDNLTMTRLERYSRWGFLSLETRRQGALEWMNRAEVKAASSEQPIRQLSGGNQQKVAIARVLHHGAEIILFDEPTRGIDVGTKSAVYRWMGELAAEGKAIIFVSSYLAELMAICDRIAVMSRGELREIRPRGDWTEEAIMNVAVGV